MEADGKEKKGDEANPPSVDNNEVESRFLYQRKGPYELPAILQPKFSRQNANVKKEKKSSKENLAASQEKPALKLKSSNEKVDVKKKKSTEKASEKPAEEPTPQVEDKTSGEKGEKTSGETPQSAEKNQPLQEQVKVDEGKPESPAPQEKPVAEETAPTDPKTKTKTGKKDEKKKEKGCKTLDETDRVKKAKSEGEMGKTPRRKKEEENAVSPTGLLPEVSAKDASPNFIKQATSPVPPKPSPMPNEQKSKAPKSTAPVKKVSRRTAQQEKDRKTMGFFKAVYAKTKFWSRKSDCVAQPTPEMLKKICVPCEYGIANDFKPDLKKSLLTKDEVKARKKNAGYTPNAVFHTRRPFWLIRLPTDTFPPKCKIQMHKQVKQAYQGNTTLLKPRQPPRVVFLHPIRDSVEKMMALDKAYGREVNDVQKRVNSNTFYATLMFETEKVEAEKRKSRMMEREKTPTEFVAKKVSFRDSAVAPKIIVNCYDRKDRANIDKRPCRAFRKVERAHAQTRGAPKTALPPCTSASLSDFTK